MSYYTDIVGRGAYADVGNGYGLDIVGRNDFNGAFNQPGMAYPNWGPVPGYGPNLGPFGLAIGAEGDPAASYGAIGPAPMGYYCPQGQLPVPNVPMIPNVPNVPQVVNPAPAPATAGAMVIGPNGQALPAFGPGFAAGLGPWGPAFCGPTAVPNGNALATLIAARESFLVQQNCFGKARREPLGLGRTCVGPCETVTITVSPQILFKPYRLVIPADVAYQFQIESIKFGKWNFFANGGSIPASTFLPEAEDTDFNGDTVQPNGTVSITVTNTSNASAEFKGTFWGKAIEGC